MQPALRLVLVLAVLLLAGAGATPASAGMYPVYACDPSHGDVNNSWQTYSNRKGILVYVACRYRPGSLGPWDQGLVTRAMINRKNKRAKLRKGASARLMFHAPPGATLIHMTFVGSLCGSGGHMALIQADVVPVAFGFGHPPFACRSTAPTHRVVPLLGRTNASLRTTCALKRCSVGGGKPRAWAAMRSATVFVDDRTRPSIRVTGGSAVAGWRRGVADVHLVASDNVGVQAARIEHGGAVADDAGSTCDFTRPIPCPALRTAFNVNTRSVPDGVQPFVIRAQDAAGNWQARTVPLRIDNTAPGPPIGLGVVGGSGWRSSNSFAVQWRNPSQPETAPIAGVRSAICPAAADAEDWTSCVLGGLQRPDEQLSGLKLPRAGQWVARIWLQDAAGNEDRQTAQTVPLNLDDDAPVVAFVPIDSADPTRVDVRASDPTSPLIRTEIETRRRGHDTWIALPNTPSPTGFSARLNDETLPDGRYELRARATDSAGNEQSTYRETSGREAVRDVPMRIDTHLIAGHVKIVKGRRTRAGRRRTRRVIVARPLVHFGRTVPIRGRLTTPGGNAVAGASIEVWEQLWVRGAESRRVAMIGTNQQGWFTFRALRGPSRTLRFRYPGTALVRARTREVDLRVKASSTIESSRRRVVNGEEIVLRGRIRGGPLPPVGKLVQLQAYSRGRWLTFATPRANHRTGRWAYRYRFTSTRGTVRYRFRARIPREAGFPYAAGRSNTVRVHVRGL